MIVASWHQSPYFTDYIIAKTGYQGIRREPEEIMNDFVNKRKKFELVFKNKWQKNLPDGCIATIYVRDITPLPKAKPRSVIKKFQRELFSYINEHAKSVKGLTIKILPFSREDTVRGRFRKVTIYMKSIAIPLHKNKNAILSIENVRVELVDITINPYKLMREGVIEIISLKKLKPYFMQKEENVNSLLSKLFTNYVMILTFDEGYISVRACNNKQRLCLSARIFIEIINGNNFYCTIHDFRVLGIHLPDFIPEILTARYNPIINPMPFEIELNTILINDRILAVN